MARFALLLRGVNVGTKNSLPMVELRAMLEAAGCTGVRTLLQSGNAVFESRLGPAALVRAIEEPLARRMGRPIATTLRTLPDLRRIVDGNPFAREATDPARLCVTFLSSAPTAAEVAPIVERTWAPELVKVAGREIYSWHPDGQGKSRPRGGRREASPPRHRHHPQLEHAPEARPAPRGGVRPEYRRVRELK